MTDQLHVQTNFKVTTRLTTLAATALFALAGCGGGASTESNAPAVPGTQGATYNGPPPATSDAQAYMVELWTHLRDGGTASCGTCHSQNGGQAPTFARDDNVNNAYAESNPLTDRNIPANSRLVTKVAGGHNCWLSDPQACGDIMTTWIENWIGGSGGGGRVIQLNAPPVNPPGASKNWPPPVPADFTPVHNLLTTYCSECHSNGAGTPQSPFFADSDIAVAYGQVQSKIELDDPPLSRLVVRLRDEFHNCWNTGSGVNCDESADIMQAAITTFADTITPTQVPPALQVSGALRLVDGTVASGGNRYEQNQIALWEFKTGTGLTAFDTSGVSPAMDLELSPPPGVEWVGGFGIDISDGQARALTTTSRKLRDLIVPTGEYAIEAWVVPANVVQEETRIVSYSAGTTVRNFMLGQTLYSYDFLNRASTTDGNGDPALSTSDADEDLQATLQHVVANYDPVNGRQIYVNGVFTDDADPIAGGTLGDWDETFAFVLGNEVSGDRQWQGQIRMVAIHNRALTEAQILQNLDVGVGEKFFLLFHVADLTAVPDSYIMFEVSQFDSYSYLFNEPVFLSLDPTATASGVPLVGMRIGLNGQEIAVGQAYENLDLTLNDPTGQPLANIGTIVPLQQGPEGDEFFLSFDQLGNNFGPVTPPATLNPPPEVLAGEQPDVGIRTFDEINATMAEVTTVPPSEVQSTYDLVRQQLPAVADPGTFSSAQEIGIAQLAIAYCDALIENNVARRNAYFPGFDFSVAPSTAFAGAQRDLVINPVVNNIMGVGLAGSQPDFLDVTDELGYAAAGGNPARPANLIDRLIAADNSGGERTEDIAKAVCSAVLGSGVALIQ